MFDPAPNEAAQEREQFPEDIAHCQEGHEEHLESFASPAVEGRLARVVPALAGDDPEASSEAAEVTAKLCNSFV